MSASLVLVVVIAVLYASAVYLMLERSLTRVIIGFLLAGNATNLLLLVMAGGAGVAPIVAEDIADRVPPEQMTDPLPQALILTAIVITFGVTAFLLGLLYRSWRVGGAEISDDVDDVAMRGATVMRAEQIDEAASDTEFAPRADTPDEANQAAAGTAGERERE